MKLLLGATYFVVICMMGWIIGNAGGVHWGTEACGWLAFITLFIAGLVFTINQLEVD